MKKIGLVGGISWTSTIDYYRHINEAVNLQLGGLDFAECLIYSVNFNDFRRYNAAHDWESTYRLLADAALRLKDAGADLLLLGANTAHIVAERISDTVGLPLIDIREATAAVIHAERLKKVGLLRTVSFDAVSTQAQEAVNPTKDIPFTSITSLIICMTLYIFVSLTLTGIVKYTELALGARGICICDHWSYMGVSKLPGHD